MVRNRLKPATLFATAGGLVLAAHVLLNAHFTSRSELISYAFFLPLSIAALVLSVRRARHCSPGMRRSWTLLSVALLFWVVAASMAAGAYFFSHTSQTSASIDDFFYFFYGIPILLAIASPEDSQLVPELFWLDSVLACGVGYLAYIVIFAAIPFSGVQPHPITVTRLIWIYDGENTVLASLATIRLLVTPRGAADRRFFQILTAFVWIYGISACVYNHLVASTLMHDAGLLDGLVDIPFLLLIYTVAFWSSDPVTQAPRSRRSIALSVDNTRPVLLGLALVGLAAVVIRQHFEIAVAVVFSAFVLYGVRSSVLQGRFLKSQMALEAANQRLQDLTLEDSLTGIANRRCFNQRFPIEWNRAHRTRTPLSLLLIDIDHFKKLNDTYGHLTGDECLIQVAQTLRTVLNRPGDLLARYGGEEFAVLLPETDGIGARNVAALLQDALAGTEQIPGIDAQVTISIGASTWEPGVGARPDQLLDSADRALYRAKQNGRNRAEYLPLESSLREDASDGANHS